MPEDDDARIVVVGAGPVGLLLAGLLRRSGADVVVLEQLTAPTTESRASTLHARTMEILDGCGVRDRLGAVEREPRGHFGGIGLDLTLPVPHPGQWKVPQTRLEEVLARWARELGVRIRRGHEVIGLTRAADHVTVDVRRHGPGRAVRGTVRAGWLVGCDGERGAVGRLGGFTFTGGPARRELLRADVAGLTIAARRFERAERGLLVAAPLPGGVTRVMVHERGAEPLPGPARFADLVAAWRRVAGEDIAGGVPLWVNSFDDACRQADRYRIGRLLLAGDAAHRQLPIGGQSLNLGLQDAWDLGRKLAAVACGRAPAALLDSYHDERHRAGRQVQDDVRAQALLLFGGPEVDAVRQVLAELTGHERVRVHLARRIGGWPDRPDGRPATAGTGTGIHDHDHDHGDDHGAGDGDVRGRRGEAMGRLTGRTALVTGSSRGMGRATAIRLAADGALVAVHYAENKDAAAEVVAAIESDGGRAFAVGARLGVPGDVEELFGALEPALLDRTGSTDLNILVNNAGVMSGTEPLSRTTEGFDRLFAVNARAPYFLIRRALENMPDGGRIVNISSGLTRCANPDEIVYAMSKGALEQLALHFAKLLGPRGITVNSVAPGITRNDQPVFRIAEAVDQMAARSVFHRVGEPEDIADVVAFLATDEARWITGSFVDATGGTLVG